MSLNEIPEEAEESPEFLAELDARIRALEAEGRMYTIAEARQMVREVCKSV